MSDTIIADSQIDLDIAIPDNDDSLFPADLPVEQQQVPASVPAPAPAPVIRYSQRQRQPRDFYAPMINYDQDMTLMTIQLHKPPKDYYEAITSEDEPKWKLSMDEEMEALRENNTWILTTLPPGRKAINSMWVYDYKYDENGKIVRYKSRLVAKGCSQKDGIDYHETFAPVMKYKSLRIILAIVAIQDLELVQMDVKTAF